MVLTLECKGCGGKGPLADGSCMGRALEALAAENAVDTIIISGHLETQLQRPGMAVLERIVALAGDMHQLSLRDPPHGCRDRQRCALRPGELFAGLRACLLSDAASFPSALRDRLARMMALVQSSSQSCRPCLDGTAEDLDLLAESFGELARFIMKQGFQIVV
jgi:hypothetical protein